MSSLGSYEPCSAAHAASGVAVAGSGGRAGSHRLAFTVVAPSLHGSEVLSSTENRHRHCRSYAHAGCKESSTTGWWPLDCPIGSACL